MVVSAYPTLQLRLPSLSQLEFNRPSQQTFSTHLHRTTTYLPAYYNCNHFSCTHSILETADLLSIHQPSAWLLSSGSLPLACKTKDPLTTHLEDINYERIDIHTMADGTEKQCRYLPSRSSSDAGKTLPRDASAAMSALEERPSMRWYTGLWKAVWQCILKAL